MVAQPCDHPARLVAQAHSPGSMRRPALPVRPFSPALVSDVLGDHGADDSFLPIFALVTGKHFVNVTYADYFLHMLPLALVLILLAFSGGRATGLISSPHTRRSSPGEGLGTSSSCAGPGPLMGGRWRLDTPSFCVGARPISEVDAEKGSASADHLPLRVIIPYCVIALHRAGRPMP